MIVPLNVRLTALCFFLVFLTILFPAQAQETEEPAMVAEELESVELSPALFVELYTSQACVFCPEADRLFGDLVKMPDIIGVSCHVDYFDVKTNSLAKPFCTDRQSWYVDRLKAGPNYTPQMIINGHRDVVGYKTEEIAKALEEAKTEPLEQIRIASNESDSYSVRFPDSFTGQNESGSLILWMAVYLSPTPVKIAEGRNRGQDMVYYKVLSGLKEIPLPDPGEGETTIVVKLAEGEGGFALLLQDKETGRISAAGEFERKNSL